MNHDEQDELWNLLGKAREPKAPAFFAGKVLRAMHEEPKPTIWEWLRRKWIIPMATVAGAITIAVIALQPVTPRVTKSVAVSGDPIASMAAAATQDEIDAFDASLNTFLAAEDHSVWLSADPSSLY